MASTKSFCTWRRTLSNSCAPSNSVNAPVREPRLRSQPPVISAPNSVPATITARARADALGSLSFILYLTLDAAEWLRERRRQRGDDAREHRIFAARPIYQLDRTALRMGVLPGRLDELSKSISDSIVEIVAGALHPVALPARVRPPETFSRRNVQQERQVGYQATRRQPVGGADFFLRQAASHDLVRVGGKKEAIEKDHVACGERGRDLPNRVAHWSPPGLADSDHGDAGNRQPL